MQSTSHFLLENERDIVKFFGMSSVAVRPEASAVIFAKVQQLSYNEHKRVYLERMLKIIKQKQTLLLHNQGGSGFSNAGGQMILDYDTAVMAVQQLSIKEVDTYLKED
jgi:hypothetical protein